MDKRIERALNHPACIKPLHKTGWEESGSSIKYFSGEFVEYTQQAAYPALKRIFETLESSC